MSKQKVNQMTNQKVNLMKICIIMLVASLLCLLPVMKARAESASAVSFGIINYELLTMQIYNNNNSVVYYSTDNSTWTAVDGVYNSATKSYTMDLSWVSASNDVTLYFKGDSVKTVKSITLPMQNNTFSVDYDKVEGTFTFNNAEEADTFEWRKNTDYYWRAVSMDESSSSYVTFLRMIEKFKVTGATIIIRLPQAIGTGADNVGLRPSAAKSITIAQRSAAPVIRVNSSRLTVNTTTALEYYDSVSDFWIECSGAMSLEELAPQVLYENGATVATIKFRKATTASTPYSKTATLTIPAQKAAPVIGDSSADVTYYYMNSKLMLQFNKANQTNMYEYIIIKNTGELNLETANWKSVKSSDLITITSTTAPEGSTVYVRRKGTDESEINNTDLILASAYNSFSVDY